MKIEIAGKLYESDITPIKERTRESIMGLVQNTDKAGMLLRPAVKAACTLAMSFLGLKKVNRNDDPVEIIALFLIEHIFGGLERNGLRLEGQEILPAASPVIEEKNTIESEGLRAKKECSTWNAPGQFTCGCGSVCREWEKKQASIHKEGENLVSTS